MTAEHQLPELPADNKCTGCGGSKFTLAQDKTVYTPIDIDGGELAAGAQSEEVREVDELGSTRFFCTSCGTYYSVPNDRLPEELQEAV
jgi:hypothetical protein